MMIVNMRFEMIGEINDSGGEQRHLDFRGTCVLRGHGEVVHNLRLGLRG
jgi:hypothetical protein